MLCTCIENVAFGPLLGVFLILKGEVFYFVIDKLDDIEHYVTDGSLPNVSSNKTDNFVAHFVTPGVPGLLILHVLYEVMLEQIQTYLRDMCAVY